MTRRNSPTVRRRRLGSELRRIRDELRRPADEVVKYMGWSLSKLSRIESGKSGVAWEAVVALLEYYGITGERRDALIALAREARQEGWWQPYNDFLSKDYSTYIGLETAAASLRLYQAQGLPGLFQTADYAYNIIAEGGALDLSDAEIERRVDLRLQRQAVLDGDNPLEVWAVLDEACLRRRIGGDETMRFQLLHLTQAARRPNVNIQVMPFGAGAHASMTGAFGIFSFDAGEPDVPFVESFAGTLYIEIESEVRAANLTYDHLRATARSAADSLRLIRTVVKEYE